MEEIRMGAAIKGAIERNVPREQKFLVSSIWDFECLDKDGSPKWTEKQHNICTDEGLNALLNIMFHGASQISTWYIALFENDYTPLSTDTYASPGYTESTAYDESTRPEFVEAAASGKSLSNSASKASFTMNATKTIYGGALVGGGTGASTKGDTAGGGTLYCASKFDSAKPVESGDILKVTVTLTSADI